ncbi:sensor histidine kinase [Amycolatopsis sp. 195334CR]|uniref:sensor histidine kinase n=1 Tax=Amycolatopsis sp. 195334CR TaxID=2814588 RepID=UPI001A8E7DD7|nr:histidine kinase [Amycolatopsis sp. 195334CR]MBN6040979.1 two-component sensor histidine kinase [Amycolatopsis sp. 195334CR]
MGSMFLSPGQGNVIGILADGNATVVSVLKGTLMGMTVLGVYLLLWRTWPLFTAAALAMALASLWPGLVAASYLAGTHYRRLAHLTAYIACASVVTLSPTVFAIVLGRPGQVWSRLLQASGGISLFVWLPLAIGLWVGARRQVVAGLRRQAEHQEIQHAAQVRELRARERARIAHEMHDVVAHRVSLMVLHAGVLEVNTKEEKSAETAALIRTTGREALAQLRDVLGVLRTGAPAEPTEQPVSTLEEIGELVADSQAAGIPVQWYRESVPEVPPMVAQTAFQVVREALTNVHKHAGAVDTEVEVVEMHNGQAIEVRVCNAAPAERPEPLPGNGLGLLGLRERVELVGGTFRSRRLASGGWLVTARLPYAGKEAP